MRSEEELVALHREAEAEFKKYPGVVGVGYGYKQRAGETTRELAFRVYVVEKKSKAELSPDEVIPSEFKGIPTDVIKARRIVDVAGCEHTSLDGPLISGITVSNLKSPSGSTDLEVGTLGFFATIDGQDGPDNVVYVSNRHVLMAHGAHAGDPVYRPRFTDTGAVVLNDSPQRGVIHDEGFRGNKSFAYPSETARPFWIDASSAKIGVCISSWCHTNCGTEFKNEVRGFHIDADPANNITADTTRTISNVKRLQLSDLPANGDYIVYKVGRSTGLTVGKVTEVLLTPGDPENREGLIEIEAIKKDCDGAGTTERFVDGGDSGSALLNSRRELIGLIISRSPDDPKIAYASHIHPVLDQLHVTPITVAAPHSAAETFSNAPGRLADGRPNHTPELRARVSASERGRQLLDLVETHRDEVVRLVNRRRPVTVAWHRGKGPAFLGHAVEGVRDPAHTLPREIDGVTRADLLESMRRVLDAHGSAALRAAMARHADEARALAELLDNPHQILAHLERREEP